MADSRILASMIAALRKRAAIIEAQPYGEVTIKWDTNRPLQVELTTKDREPLIE